MTHESQNIYYLALYRKKNCHSLVQINDSVEQIELADLIRVQLINKSLVLMIFAFIQHLRMKKKCSEHPAKENSLFK